MASTVDQAQNANLAYSKALRHSANVRRLKILLPLIALIISAGFVGFAALQSYLPENVSIAGATIEDGKIVMSRPAISGRNNDGISYSMTADRALQDIASPEMITLETIRAKMPVGKDVMASIAAKQGIYNRNTNHLELTKPFTIALSTGLIADMQSASVDFDKGELTTLKPVTVHSPDANIVADKLMIRDNGNRIVFDGNVKFKIKGSAMEAKGQ